MPSLIPGFEYDIFISYRQKDNKGDHWVTEFVNALKTELEATFKEDISIYFDENAHDGLLETHIVDKSLEGKLTCLIFIPIISQTYCDNKSFAWQHEFCAFNKLSKEDQFGRDIKLSNGNVASRVLPVKIHDLEAEDKAALENEISGVLRAIEFIYKEPGVNRPLKSTDNKNNNQNKTDYRNQVNKVANAIKEITVGLRVHDHPPKETLSKTMPHLGRLIEPSVKRRNQKILALTSLAILIVLLTGYILANFTPVGARFYPKSGTKSIAVLPFDNLSNDPNQEYFSVGMMDEILNHLYKIGNLKVTSRTSSMSYKGSKKTLKEIATELDVAHLLEGSVQKDGNRIRIIVQLIDGKTDEHLWSETYDKEFKDVFGIQSDVAQQVAAILKIKIDPDVKRRIELLPTQNTEAYDLLLRSRNAPTVAVSTFGKNYERVKLLEQAIALDPNFAEAYSDLATYWIYRGAYFGDLRADEVLRKALPLTQKALEINPDLASGHRNLALISLYYIWDFAQVETEYRKIRQLYPSNTEDVLFFIDYLLATEKFREALDVATHDFQVDKNNKNGLALSYYFNNHLQKSLDMLEETESPSEYTQIQVYAEKYEIAIIAFKKMKSFESEMIFNERRTSRVLGLMAIAHYKTGQSAKARIFLDTLIERSEKSPVGSPSYYTAAAYTAMDRNDLALEYLEKAYRDHEVEMYWIKVEPLFRALRREPRFQVLVENVFKSKK